MFIPLLKVDAAQRLVYGCFDETPDHSKEVFDYATSKPNIQSWSDKYQKATDGVSFGNIREQHGKVAAGRLDQLEFNDMTKSVQFCAKIVDDGTWKKIEDRVITGFSPGGRYAKRWQDGDYTRYTAEFSELSVVDCPCNPNATFTLVKADGTEEQVDFILSKAYEPGNDATKTRADEMAKAAGADAKGKDYVVQARADLIAENAADALAKMAEAEPVEPEAKPDAADALTASLAKADAAIAAASGEEVPGLFADLAKVSDALKLLSAEPLAKSLWSVEWLTKLLGDFASLQASVTWDEKYEAGGGDMTIPTQAAKIVKDMGDLLIVMAQEGVADLLSCMADKGIDVVILEGDSMALATSIVDLVKADATLMEKAGARNSKSDAAAIQSMHDNSVKLGATCDTTAEKAEQLAAENERLVKAVGDATPRIEKLVATVETLTAENVMLKALPAPPKGSILAISKEEDSALEKVADTAEDESNLTLIERARRAAIRHS